VEGTLNTDGSIQFINKQNLRGNTMKYAEVLQTYAVLEKIQDIPKLPFRFAYGIARNMKNMEFMVNFIREKMQTKVEGQGNMEQARQAMIEEHCKRDEKGNLITTPAPNGRLQYDLSDPEKFQDIIVNFEEKWIDVIQAMELHNKGMAKFLEEDSGFKPMLIDLADLPIDDAGDIGLTIRELSYLFPFIHGVPTDEDE
jgi:hypothetical protein